MLDKKINELKEMVIGYSTYVERMIEKSIEGILKKNRGDLLIVINEDEPKANDREVEIEEECIEAIAQFEPKAKDLRTILMILKINNDLERMGDHAVNIANRGIYLVERPYTFRLNLISKMVDETLGMLKDSINSFIREDSILAKDVCKRDNVVDSLRDKVLRKFVKSITEDPRIVEAAIMLVNVAANLERIADLSTNISEDVVYIASGRVIKHRKEK
ncbi:MAG TPA: phosphate signaling complex protein PhoU [candidate division WOR-3 bacterium]|uniref:Phosphate-specific transport system accessory protein PhoU n=1 Tax=candidate division WOR-3 bacterium TaxID=2052148 RepID=A0A7C5HGB4_UNCW3|nr:phosphate signaling complex protein PhoU [candidate division WOR-3 bacterium]